MFSRITSDKHVQLKNVRGHGTVSFFWSQNKKGRDARSCGTRAHDDGRSFDIDKRHCTAVSGVVRRVSRQGLLRPSVRSLRSFVHLGSRPSSLTTFVYACLLSHQDRRFEWVFVAVQETQTVRWSAALLHTSFQHTPICGHSHEHECEGTSFIRLAARSSSSEESCTVAQKTNHDISEHIFTACHLGEAETTDGEGDRLCHVLTRNKSEGINGTPIQHHKIQRLRAPLFQHPSLA